MPLEEKLWIAVVFTGVNVILVNLCISLWALFGSLIKIYCQPKLKRSFSISLHYY